MFTYAVKEPPEEPVKLAGDAGQDPVDDAMHTVPTVVAANPSGRAEGTMRRALIANVTMNTTAEFVFLKKMHFFSGTRVGFLLN
jgi:hypothetical protein